MNSQAFEWHFSAKQCSTHIIYRNICRFYKNWKVNLFLWLPVWLCTRKCTSCAWQNALLHNVISTILFSFSLGWIGGMKNSWTNGREMISCWPRMCLCWWNSEVMSFPHCTRATNRSVSLGNSNLAFSLQNPPKKTYTSLHIQSQVLRRVTAKSSIFVCHNHKCDECIPRRYWLLNALPRC